jgi:ABC-type multidrug transport system ATPase subunit
MTGVCALTLAVAVAVRSAAVGAGAGVAAWIVAVLGRGAKPADRREIRRRLGYLPQHLGYYPSFTVVEFVEYFALLKEVPPHLVPKAVAAAVEKVDLGPKAKAKLRTLSGGMLRRVGIAQAIVNERSRVHEAA